jgi:hypothetical protein
MDPSTGVKLCLIFTACSNAIWSQNLVPNPSFEEYRKLNCEWIRFLDLYQGKDPQKAFDSLLYYWGTPDKDAGVELFSTLVSPTCFKNNTNCLSEYCTTNPVSIGAFPKDGNNMCLITLLGYYENKQNERGYLQTPLLSQLSANTKYLAGCYTMLPTSYFGDFACNNLGLLFTSNAVKADTLQGNDVLNYPPQVNQENVNKDHGVWKKVFGCFTSSGSERYLTIGNFYDDNHTKAELIINPYDLGDDFAPTLLTAYLPKRSSSRLSPI